jgi:thioredoxin reductase (NADPH)
VTTQRGVQHLAPVIFIAGGLGSFEPRKPPIDNIAAFEDHGVEYFVRTQRCTKASGWLLRGVATQRWTGPFTLANIAKEITLIHRRTEFRGALDSVEKVQHLVEKGRVRLITNAQITGLQGNGKLESLTVLHDTEGESLLPADHFVPLFGLTPKLGPIAEWVCLLIKMPSRSIPSIMLPTFRAFLPLAISIPIPVN